MKRFAIKGRGHRLLVLSGAVTALALLVLPVGDAGGEAMTRAKADGRASREIMHWWVAETESSALNVLKSSYQSHGDVWMAGPQPDRSTMRHALVERLAGGVPPMATLWQAGSEFPTLTRLGILHDIDPVARAQDWDRNLLPAVRSRAQIDGHYYFAPTNIHGDNWLFYDRRVLARLGIPAPRTMREAIAAMEAVDRAGHPAVATGGSTWEVSLAFTSIMLGYLDRDQYLKLYRGGDISVLDSPQGREAFAAFDSFRRLSARSKRFAMWSEAARGVARGEAGFQILGDYAKSEMVRAGAVIGRDVGCMITSPADTGVLLVIDGFVFPVDRAAAPTDRHLRLARVIGDSTVQARFSRAKVALPARRDALPARPDACEAQLLERLERPGAVLDEPLGNLGPERVSAFNAAVIDYFGNPAMTRSEAVARMGAAIKAAPRR